jgi:uncharacterized protein
LPITNFETSKPIAGVLFSGASLMLGEIATSLIFGIGRSDQLFNFNDFELTAVPGYLAAGIMQGAIAGYGAYAVGKAAQSYLAKGSTWDRLGANTVMREILKNIDGGTIVARLRDELIALPVETNSEPESPKNPEEKISL